VLYSAFVSAQFEKEVLSGSYVDGLNACVECCDRWASKRRDALLWISREGKCETYTFVELQTKSAQLANLMAQMGVAPGDVVGVMLPQTPELLIVMLAVWRMGAIYQPLSTSLESHAVRNRTVTDGSSHLRLIVTDEINRQKCSKIAREDRALVVLTGQRFDKFDKGFLALVSDQSAIFQPIMRSGSDPFILMFTSGADGPAKGVGMRLGELLQIAVFTKHTLDLVADDIFWCVADLSWSFGMRTAIVGPLLFGHCVVLSEAPPSPASICRVMRQVRVRYLAATPPVFRIMQQSPAGMFDVFKGQLRAVVNGGGALDAETSSWIEETLGSPAYNCFGQTESGGILSHQRGMTLAFKRGCLGVPNLGMSVAILNDRFERVRPGDAGNLAVDRTSSQLFFFRGYWNESESKGQWYLTGDVVWQDAEGYIYHVGRRDDVIKCSGYRIGPLEIENVLNEYEGVSESAVVGQPDRYRGQSIKAYVVLRPGYAPSSKLSTSLRSYVRGRLSSNHTPRNIVFVTSLPKTSNGKIQRGILRQDPTWGS
jgi:acetyl-CoA synthetase